MGRFCVALVHHPVLHKDGSTITSAITNTDLHDIARSCTTFRVDRYYVVSPVTSQQELAKRLHHHWVAGDGARKNPDRARAFACMEVVASLQEAAAAERARTTGPVELWASSARMLPSSMTFEEGRAVMDAHDGSITLVLGTAFGLTAAALELCQRRLQPIPGRPAPDGTSYNHLSVRAAAAIMLHRLRG